MNQKPSPGHIVVLAIVIGAPILGWVQDDAPEWIRWVATAILLPASFYALYRWETEKKAQASLDMIRYAPTETPNGPQSQRAARLGAFVENVDMTTLLNRDGWRCGICGNQIDPRLRHPNPQAGTLDHIIPLNKGGQHRYRNAQAAHYSCNSSKGDRVRPEDLARYKELNQS